MNVTPMTNTINEESCTIFQIFTKSNTINSTSSNETVILRQPHVITIRSEATTSDGCFWFQMNLVTIGSSGVVDRLKVFISLNKKCSVYFQNVYMYI